MGLLHHSQLPSYTVEQPGILRQIKRDMLATVMLKDSSRTIAKTRLTDSLKARRDLSDSLRAL
ncbi:MAG: hypothetical protein E5W38_35145 [Mesorhizobium sp.]|nr:MAG: hypothetical protein E5W38_35145 [Mesorhizobium sp.]TKB20563.1 MAG: hypothetical protein E5V75_04270 [Mesorhizobium sp.]